MEGYETSSTQKKIPKTAPQQTISHEVAYSRDLNSSEGENSIYLVSEVRL